MPNFYFSWVSRESEPVVERIAAACATFLEGKCVLGKERDGFVPEKIKNSLARCDALFVVIGEESSASEGSGGRIVDRLKDQLKEESGEWAEGLLVIGKIHSPGLVVLRSAEVELIPIVGKRCILPLNQIDFIKEGRWLPGKFVWGKRAFNFQTSIRRPLAFAVAESIGARWSVALRNRVAR